MASSDLLSVRESDKPFAGKNTLFLELPVSPLTAPYLVSSTRSLFWQTRSKGGMVRAALRRDAPLESLYQEIVLEMSVMGVTAKWGNVLPVKNNDSAEDYLSDFDVSDTEFLCCAEHKDILGGTVVDWMPPGYSVLVPKDRDILGVALKEPDGITVLLHNPSRSMVVLTDVV